jgi:hypothetical protein
MTIEAQLDRIIQLLEAKAPTATAVASPVAATAPTVVVAEPTAPAEAPKRRGRPAKQQTASDSATAPEAAATTPVASAAAPEAPATGASDDKVYTESDLRTALTMAQTRLGGKEKPLGVLKKYAGEGKPAIIASIAAADYGKVIAECAALS